MNEELELDEPLTPLTPEHRERVLMALEVIEQAQGKLYDAAELLCPVPGLADEWESVRNHALMVKQLWGIVDAAFKMLDVPNRR